MFLDRIRDEIPPNVREDRCCPTKATGLTPEEVLDDVLTGKCEAALVDVSSLIAYQNNRPGLAAGLRVLKESLLLPSAVVVYRKDSLTAIEVDAVRDGLLKCTKTAQGRTFVIFWNLKGFSEANAEYAAALERCLKAYPAPANPK
jgi:ABC-type phosphate/phosphonate transport system substrate-binding protein